MAEFIHVVEAAGRVVRMPDAKRLPAGGALVEKSVFVMRCIADGDLEVVPEARAADGVPEAPAAAPAGEHVQ